MLAIWWLRCLDGLPDIGDPFDVAEFRAFRIPDQQNALVLMRRAADKFTPMHLNVSIDDPRLHDWFESNRPLVERFIQAADQADGISGPELDGDWRYYPNASNLGAGMVISMTYIEGGRCAERGDMAGAWNCYRAILRMYVHLRRRERVNDRLRATLHHGELQQRLTKWAADPRTTIPQVRRALEEVIACRPRPEWDAFTLEREYLDLMQFLEGPVNPPPEEIEKELTYRLGDLALPADLTPRIHGIKRRLARAGTQPPGHPLTVRQLVGTCGAPRPAATTAGRAGAIPRCTTDDQRPLYPVGPQAPEAARRCHRGRWQAGWSRPRTLEWPSSTRGSSGRPFARGNSAAIGSGSCSWPVSSITASAAPSRLRKTRWSVPISKACPTTVRPSSAMKRHQPFRIPPALRTYRRSDARRRDNDDRASRLLDGDGLRSTETRREADPLAESGTGIVALCEGIVGLPLV